MMDDCHCGYSQGEIQKGITFNWTKRYSLKES